MRIATLLLASLALLATSCGGGSSDPAELTSNGQKALGTQDFASALADFEAALAAIGGDTSHPSYLRAKLGAVEARSASDAQAAVDELIELAGAMPGKVSDRDYNRIAGRMGDAGHFEQAIALLAKGKEEYPESAHLDKLGNRLADEAKKSGDSSALDALAGLGYVGD
jgi:tetratricopeptide (TPR) repeat protein